MSQYETITQTNNFNSFSTMLVTMFPNSVVLDLIEFYERRLKNRVEYCSF